MPRTYSVADNSKTQPLNMRTTAEIRAKLEAAAQASGRSLIREVERRLERSFERSSTVIDLFAATLRAVEDANGKMWLEDAEMKGKTRAAFLAILDVLMPEDGHDPAAEREGLDIAADVYHSVLAETLQSRAPDQAPAPKEAILADVASRARRRRARDA